MAKHTVEIFVSMNEDGDWSVGHDEVDTFTACIENCGGTQIRTVKFTVIMSAPEATAGEVDVPDSAGTVEATEVKVA